MNIDKKKETTKTDNTKIKIKDRQHVITSIESNDKSIIKLVVVIHQDREEKEFNSNSWLN